MIRACIFDLGGTIVDRYSLTPFLSLKKVFNNHNISVTNQLIFKDMGKNKKDHLIDILSDQKIMYQWINNYHGMPRKKDIDSLFEDFNEIQMEYSDKMIDILPETKKCIDFLQFNYIQTGVTTGFNYGNMNIIRDKLERNQIYLDSYVSSTCLKKPSRPHPHMIEQNMLNLHIKNPKEIIKIDDTVVGIHEGLRANCWTVGVARWSINMGIQSIEDAYGFSDEELIYRIEESRNILKEAGADYVIDTLDELPKVIESIKY